MKDSRGKLYVFEGPDGVGKSTLSKRFADALREQGIPTEHLAFPGRDQGTLGHHIYKVHHGPAEFGVTREMTAASRQLLHIAAHADAIEAHILPALLAGRTVVLDRFWWSTFVYGAVDGIERRVLEAIIQPELEIWGGYLPDMAFLIDREQAYRSECTEDRFQALRSEYRVMAAKAAQSHRVATLENNEPIDNTVLQLLAAI